MLEMTNVSNYRSTLTWQLTLMLSWVTYANDLAQAFLVATSGVRASS